jgi:ATP-dependent Clp protease ATP-binding subunit ClpA
LAQQLDQALAPLPIDSTVQHAATQILISARVQSIIQRAEALANMRPDLHIDTNHLLMAICEETDGASAQILQSVGITPQRLQVLLVDVHTAQQPVVPQATGGRAEWEQQIEQQLTRIETELTAIRAMLSRSNSGTV